MSRILIERCKEKALQGEKLSLEELVSLLEMDPDSEEAKMLGAAAGKVARKYTAGQARLWGAIGVDYKPCEMNCAFCSLGKKWGIVTEEKEYSLEEMLRQVHYYVENGFYYILLRTTEFYSAEKLGQIIAEIKKQVPGDYILGSNIGELDAEKAEYLYGCGAGLAYHCMRLREGTDTIFDPAERRATLEAIRDSKLDLGFWVEPVGPEHTNLELAEKILETISYNTRVCGVMARIPVEGTPLGKYPQISDTRLAQITAVLRLACGSRVRDICTHPAMELAVQYGANVITLETGSIPREAKFTDGYWLGVDAAQVKEWFSRNGYSI